MSWKQYAIALLLFNVLGAVIVYGLQRLQLFLPLNPQKFAAVSPDSSFNTAVSFITNTNWQGYSGESTMGYLVQMAGLAVQNFLSAATGIVVAIAVIRGFARHTVKTIGNFWVDVTRATLYVLLPLSAVLALVLVSQGVIQNFDGYKDATTVEKITYQNPKTDADGNPLKDAAGNAVTETATTQTQTLPMGPIASQESIKELGTNGGGFYNANSAHPYENPTPLTNLLEMLAIFIIPFALTYTFGKMVGDTRQGWVILAAMLILFVPLVMMAFHSEQHGNPLIAQQGIDQVASAVQPGGNMEGKETRFGIAASALFAAVTTATSCGAVNTMHDSMTPLGGFVPLFLIELGEVAPGGVGTGLYSMLMFAILGVFIAGLDDRPDTGVHRQEDRGPRNEVGLGLHPDDPVRRADRDRCRCHDGCRQGRGRESRSRTASVKFSMRSPRPPTTTAARSRVFLRIPSSTTCQPALRCSSARFWPIVAALAMAGSLAAKKRVPVTEGTMPTHGPLFVALLIGSILLDRCPYLRPGTGAGTGRRALHARGCQITSFLMSRQQLSLFDRKLFGPALLESVIKLDPRIQWRNPVMFVVYIGTIVTAILYGQALAGHGEAPPGFILAITIWLLFTVLFANFAEALAEGRSRAQASALRNMRQTVMAKRIVQNTPGLPPDDARQGGGLAERRYRAGRDARHHPGRRRSHRGRRLGRRERHHRRVGAGHSRIGRRLLVGDGRHAGAVGLDCGARVGQPGRDISRPDDLDGRSGEATEDAQRDRSDHLAGRIDAGLSRRDRHAAYRSRCSPSRLARRVPRSR